jgi:lipopolysaccharide export LptBFGC system permease protein LptF
LANAEFKNIVIYNKVFMKNKKGNVAVIAIIIVIVAITAGVIGWMFAKKSQVSVQEIKPATQLVSDNETANWQKYGNRELGFEFKYPTDMKAINNPQQKNIVIENSNQKNFISLIIHYDSSFYKTCNDFKEMFKDIKKVEKNIKTDSVDIQTYEFNIDDLVDSVAIFRSCWEHNGVTYAGSIATMKANGTIDLQGEADLIKKILSTFKFTN